MAFTGTPTFVMVSDRKVRITGLSITGAADGIIVCDKFAGATPWGGVRLPGQFLPENYSNSDGTVTLASSIECRGNCVNAVGLSSSKTGTNAEDLQITVAATGTTGVMELYVEFH